MSDPTKDQIAAVMLQHGTPEQQAEALAYCKAPVTAQPAPQGVEEVMELVRGYAIACLRANRDGGYDDRDEFWKEARSSITALVQERDALRARVAELEPDAARLDFLEARGLTLCECCHQERRLSTSAVVTNGLVYVFDGFAVGISGEVKPTHREAIDAAIAAAKEPK